MSYQRCERCKALYENINFCPCPVCTKFLKPEYLEREKENTMETETLGTSQECQADDIKKTRITKEDIIKLEVKYSLGELADLWHLSGFGTQEDGSMGIDWEHRAQVFEGMIMELSPRHAEYAKIKDK